MSEDRIKAALKAAAMTQCCDNWDEQPPDVQRDMLQFTGSAIAVFLRALPADVEIHAALNHATEFQALAAAVERAADSGGSDGE